MQRKCWPGTICKNGYSNQLLWKLLAAVWGAGTADPMHSRVWFAAAQFPTAAKHIMNSQRKSCLQIPSPLRRNSLVSQLRCTFANCIKALAYGTHEACFGIMFLLLESAPPPFPTLWAQKLARTQSPTGNQFDMKLKCTWLFCFHQVESNQMISVYTKRQKCLHWLFQQRIYNYLLVPTLWLCDVECSQSEIKFLVIMQRSRNN